MMPTSRCLPTLVMSAVLLLSACTEQSSTVTIDALAERYVRLALAFGEIDTNFVDAYTGPAEWREQAVAADLPLSDQLDQANAIAAVLEDILPAPGEDRRLAQLKKNLQALITRMQMASGIEFSFNEEARLLYDAVPPDYDIAEFDAALAELEALLPGEGALGERVEALRNRLVVDPDDVPAVMEAAIAECRARTKAHYDLPEGERFDMEFVTGQPWSAYNWYQGNNRSLIQVNLDQPFVITRALDLGCHEGYPGHHVWNLYVENQFIEQNGWLEYQVFPLFAPGALFGEGSANYGVDIAFPGDSRLTFEQDVLYPLAGLSTEDGDRYEAVNDILDKLDNARTHISRQYLDGEISRETAIDMAVKYRLMTRSRAAQSADFDDTYRAYIINYTLGKDLVKNYIENRASTDEERWAVFEELLRTPTSASDLLE